MHKNILLSFNTRKYIEPAYKSALPKNLSNLIEKIPRYSFVEVILFFFYIKVSIVLFSLILDLGYETFYQIKSDYPITTLMTLRLIGSFYGFIFLPIIFIYSSASTLFCFYQKYSKNEDFKDFKASSTLPIVIIFSVFNFHNILCYYLWKRKFKNTKCFIEEYTFYLIAKTNHSLIENSEVVPKNPITKGVLKGKIFLCEIRDII